MSEKINIEGLSEDQIKDMFFNMLQWVYVNRFSWIQEFKDKMEKLTPEEREKIDWSSDNFG